MNKWITSDMHIGHKNILTLGKGRPYKDIAEHNQVIIDNWNSLVKPNDEAIIVGDLTWFQREDDIERLIAKFNGSIRFVWGNHDKELMKCRKRIKGFQSYHNYLEDKIYDPRIKKDTTLCIFHYPILEWNKRHHGSWLAYGHCHGNKITEMNNIGPGSWDVGVDSNDFKPINYDELAAKIITTYNGKPFEYNRYK